jgi:serine phosphatase RsbU (regulator of sigma subunit)
MGDFLSAKSLSNRVLLVVIVSFSILTGYFIYNSYHQFLSNSEEQVVNRLYSIAKTASLQVDGEEMEYLINKYPNKDAITTNEQDSIYSKINKQLLEVVKANEMTTSLYTMVRSKEGPYFEFIVSSSEIPYFRHSYKEFPDQLLNDFELGGKLNVHSSENGMWLSAFAPVKNDKGETVAVIQADRNFEEFYAIAKAKLVNDLLISLGIFVVILLIVLKFLRSIIKNEEEQKRELETSYKIIAHKNKDISDSINYAKRIQDSFIPTLKEIKSVFPESYVFFRGKDVVSGDFPFMVKLENQDTVYIASVDCTGHGVPGALISIIGNFLLNDLIISKKLDQPCDILRALHFGVVDTLNQEKEDSLSNDGMDIALIKVDQQAKTFEFAGAHRPLIQIKDGELEEIKGSRLSIGGTHYTRRGKKMEFNNYKTTYEKGESIHFFSDGYPDQFGGPENLKFGQKNMRAFFKRNKNTDMEALGVRLEENFDDWRNGHRQMDDVLVMGIKF